MLHASTVYPEYAFRIRTDCSNALIDMVPARRNVLTCRLLGSDLSLQEGRYPDQTISLLFLAWPSQSATWPGPYHLQADGWQDARKIRDRGSADRPSGGRDRAA